MNQKSEKKTKIDRHIINISYLENGKIVESSIETDSFEDAKEYLKKINKTDVTASIFDDEDRIVFSGLINTKNNMDRGNHYGWYKDKNKGNHYGWDKNKHDDDDSYA